MTKSRSLQKVKALTQKSMLGSSAAGRGKDEALALTCATATSLAACAVATRGKPASSIAIATVDAIRMTFLQAIAGFALGIPAPRPLHQFIGDFDFES